jgi:transcriptional regulator with XRE-family HTH domain
MPASAPSIPEADRELLVRLGQALRETRKRKKVSAIAAAESAGMSRVTLHRIERGEPSVAMAAWVALASALGLALQLVDPKAPPRQAMRVPERIRLDWYPELKKLAWQLQGIEELSPKDALDLYERNWRHVDRASLSLAERSLIEALSQALGGGRLLV